MSGPSPWELIIEEGDVPVDIEANNKQIIRLKELQNRTAKRIYMGEVWENIIEKMDANLKAFEASVYEEQKSLHGGKLLLLPSEKERTGGRAAARLPAATSTAVQSRIQPAARGDNGCQLSAGRDAGVFCIQLTTKDILRKGGIR